MKQVLVSNVDPNWPKIEIDYGQTVRLYIDGWADYDHTPGIFRILYLREPDDVSRLVEFAIKQYRMFDLILTTSQKVLDECPNAKILEFGTTWIFDYKFPEKKFQISALVGHKEMTEGHKLRKKLYYKQKKITNPIDFYVSQYGGVENAFGNKVISDSFHKEELFDSQFHICIENTKQEYFFSEKVMDCFRTKTIPIFWGSPKMGHYFNLDGMIIVNNLEELINACNGIDDKTYATMLPYVEENYKLCEKYIDLPSRMKWILDKTFNNNRTTTI
jgi:hypothetical protein